MDKIASFDFAALRFDADGKPLAPTEINGFVDAASTFDDVILLAHGFRNSELEARGLYTEFLTNFAAHIPALGLGQRKFLTGGVFWPSKAFKETDDFEAESAGGTTQSIDDPVVATAGERVEAEAGLADLRDTIACEEQKPKIEQAIRMLDTLESSDQAKDKFVELVFSVLDDVQLDPTEGLDAIRSREGAQVLNLLKEDVQLPPTSGGQEGNALSFNTDFTVGDGSTQGIRDIVHSVFGAVGRLINVTTWYTMKERSGTVGAAGVADVVRSLRHRYPKLRIHLVGHSLGGRLMTSCVKAVAEKDAVTTLILLEAAFSHYGFSATPGGKPGFFRDVLVKKVVRGPILATYSAQDAVVGITYALASRLAQDNVKAIGDANDEYGGIGRNGAQNLQPSLQEVLHPAGQVYGAFTNGVVLNLDGSGGLIKNHGDVRNPAVAWAAASAIASTK